MSYLEFVSEPTNDNIPYQVLHESKELNVNPRLVGPGNAKDLIRRLHENGLREPSAPEIASILDSFYGESVPLKENTRMALEHSYIRCFTAVVYDVPYNQISFIDFPKFHDDSLSMDRKDLIHRARYGDARARILFEDLDYDEFKIDGMTPPHAKIDPFMKGLFGREGAERIARFSSRPIMKRTKFVHFPFKEDMVFVTLPIIYTRFCRHTGPHINISSNCHESNGSSYTFGIFP